MKSKIHNNEIKKERNCRKSYYSKGWKKKPFLIGTTIVLLANQQKVEAVDLSRLINNEVAIATIGVVTNLGMNYARNGWNYFSNQFQITTSYELSDIDWVKVFTHSGIAGTAVPAYIKREKISQHFQNYLPKIVNVNNICSNICSPKQNQTSELFNETNNNLQSQLKDSTNSSFSYEEKFSEQKSNKTWSDSNPFRGTTWGEITGMIGQGVVFFIATERKKEEEDKEKDRQIMKIVRESNIYPTIDDYNQLPYANFQFEKQRTENERDDRPNLTNDKYNREKQNFAKSLVDMQEQRDARANTSSEDYEKLVNNEKKSQENLRQTCSILVTVQDKLTTIKAENTELENLGNNLTKSFYSKDRELIETQQKLIQQKTELTTERDDALTAQRIAECKNTDLKKKIGETLMDLNVIKSNLTTSQKELETMQNQVTVLKNRLAKNDEIITKAKTHLGVDDLSLTNLPPMPVDANLQSLINHYNDTPFNWQDQINQVQLFKEQAEQAKQAVLQERDSYKNETRNCLQKLNQTFRLNLAEEKISLNGVIEELKKLINKPPAYYQNTSRENQLKEKLNAAQITITQLKEQSIQKTNEDLNNIKRINLEKLSKLCQKPVDCFTKQQIEQATVYQQISQVRSTFLQKHFAENSNALQKINYELEQTKQQKNSLTQWKEKAKATTTFVSVTGLIALIFLIGKLKQLNDENRIYRRIMKKIRKD